MTSAVEILDLHHRYGERIALNGISFSVTSGELFGLCGPNGGGKSTTFQILSTLLTPLSGKVNLLGVDSLKYATQVRQRLGVVFQTASLDKKLTVLENLTAQGHLYGLRGKVLRDRMDYLMTRMNIRDRANDYAEKLSGGLRRRVEVAKGLLHAPEILILDEPTTGLDPLMRRELWDHLEQLRVSEGITILVSTHLLEEADRCSRLAMLHEGKIVACGSPKVLKDNLAAQVIAIKSSQPDALRLRLQVTLGTEAVTMAGSELRIEHAGAADLIPQLMQQYGAEIESITLGKATLEDLFIQKTGYRFSERVRLG